MFVIPILYRFAMSRLTPIFSFRTIESVTGPATIFDATPDYPGGPVRKSNPLVRLDLFNEWLISRIAFNSEPLFDGDHKTTHTSPPLATASAVR